MAFMQPQIYESDYIEIDGPIGGEIIPCDVVDFQPCTCGFATAPTASAHEHHDSCETKRTYRRDVPSALRDYCENRVMWSIERKHGHVARMSAPGYMDATPWSAHETAEAARKHLDEMYGDNE